MVSSREAGAGAAEHRMLLFLSHVATFLLPLKQAGYELKSCLFTDSSAFHWAEDACCVMQRAASKARSPTGRFAASAQFGTVVTFLSDRQLLMWPTPEYHINSLE